MNKLAVVAALVALPALALGGENQWGGRLVEQPNLYAELGWPHVEGGARFRLSGVELRPHLRVSFSGLGGIHIGGVALGLSPGLGMRVRLFEEGRYAGALTFAVPVHFAFAPPWGGFTVGLGLGHPGFMATARWHDVDINFGLRVEGDVYFLGPAVAFAAAVPGVFGVEVSIAEEATLGVRAEAGPAFGMFAGAPGWGGLRRGVRLLARGLITLGYRF